MVKIFVGRELCPGAEIVLNGAQHPCRHQLSSLRIQKGITLKSGLPSKVTAQKSDRK